MENDNNPVNMCFGKRIERSTNPKLVVYLPKQFHFDYNKSAMRSR